VATELKKIFFRFFKIFKNLLNSIVEQLVKYKKNYFKVRKACIYNLFKLKRKKSFKLIYKQIILIKNLKKWLQFY
jgi:hypothetical protein